MGIPTLQFNFLHQEKVFKDPLYILSTDDIAEIPYLFEEVEHALDQGYYIAGFLSYEAAPGFNEAFEVKSGNKLPLIWFGVFSEPATHPSNKKNTNSQPYHVGSWKQSTDFENYQWRIKTIKDAIAKGDTYQINYTNRLMSDFSGSPFSFYQQLFKNQQASYSAYLDIGDFQILSVSPELFFHVKNQHIVTKPMKGTIGRGHSSSEDQHLVTKLKHSEKDRAENVMIVDLLRNDLGRIAEPGSVNVSKLFDIETYPTVHQMTSTVEATLATNKIYDWFQALFPCGSITGAPKIKTMAYIKDLEDTPREVYCGAIGMISPDREAIFNVPIRTVIIDQDRAIYGTGSGITWDSSPAEEYRELKQKAKVLYQNRNSFSLVESIKLENGHYPLLSFHLKRLLQSANYFRFLYEEEKVRKTLAKIAKENPQHTYKLRLLLHSDGSLSTDVNLVKAPLNQAICSLADSPIDKSNIYLYHKTTNRSMYQVYDHANDQYFSTLLWNEQGYITEFTLGNIVVEYQDVFYTPPVSDGLLPGTFREKLIANGEVTEKSIHMNELDAFDQIWFINSVRGWVKVELRE